MRIREIAWLGPKRARSLAEVMQSRADEWLHSWCTESLPVGVREVHFGASSAVKTWVGLRDGDNAVWVGSPEGLTKPLGCLLADIASGDEAGLAASIGKKALTDLLILLLGQNTHHVLNEAPPSAGKFPEGGFHAEVSLASEKIHVVLNRYLCERWIPIPRKGERQITSRRVAIESTPVSLKAVLALGEISVSEGRSLRSGMLFKTDIPLTGEVRLVGRKGQVVRKGVLVASVNQRAIKITTQ